jgi:hypothetical protein
VLSRASTSTGISILFAFTGVAPFKTASKSSPVARPICEPLTLIVLIAGTELADISKAPKPAIAILLGTGQPRNWQLLSAPKAHGSETHITARVSGHCAMSSSNARLDVYRECQRRLLRQCNRSAYSLERSSD